MHRTPRRKVKYNMTSPLIIGIGGTIASGSSTERALDHVLALCSASGARTRLFDGNLLAHLPHYAPGATQHSAVARDLVDAIRNADGLVLASPGYHGSISGLVKNALDYIEETARDERVYLDGVPVGLIVTAYGWQATGTTMNALRSIVHALRGWPTPMGAAIRTAPGLFADGCCTDDHVAAQLELIGRQVMDFVMTRQMAQSAPNHQNRLAV